MLLRKICANKSIANGVAFRFLGPAFFQRAESTKAVEKQEEQVPATLEEQKKYILALLKEDLPKPYEGPERDLINFPRKPRAVEPGKVRMGFLPEEWFQFFYKKTGVTGPYVFGAGLLTFLLSKELYVIEHEFSTGVAIFILAYTAIKKFGPAVREYKDKLVDEEEAKYQKIKEDAMKGLENEIEGEKKDVWYAEGQKILMAAKRENVQLQLETEYRRRLMTVYEQVKKRLDYQLEMYNTQRKMEQKHMVDWIVNTVIKSITPQQEKEALQKCIEDLKVLSARQ